MELTEIFINIPNENYDSDEFMNRIEAAIDREDVHGVFLPFTQGVSIFIEEVTNPELELSEYEEFVVSKLELEFGDEIGDIEFMI